MEKRNFNKIPIIRTVGLTKTFGSLVASNKISLDIYAGQIHALVGENGAGKSTLMKMLYGVYTPDSGEIKIDGKALPITPTKAMEYGIGMVFQDFRLIPAFTALENIALAMPKKNVKKAEIRKKIMELSSQYEMQVDPDMYVWEMDLGQRQRVEIIKVLMMEKTRVLIFDEPTSVLTHGEVESFLKMLCSLRDNKYGIVLISHKLREVTSCADTISVLRHGEITARRNKKDGFDIDELIAEMMGEEVASRVIHYEKNKKRVNIKKDKYNLECQDLSIYDDHGCSILEHIDLKVREGEILGVAGISGRGQREFLETLFGVRPIKKGTLKIDGKDVTSSKIKDRMEAGMVLVSEDPKRDNVVPGLSILEHMILSNIDCKKKGIGIDWQELKERLQESDLMKDLEVPQMERMLETLSGGNIQRVVLARAILGNPSILLASYPTRGLDIGTVNMVHQIMTALKQQGCSILLISEDLDELYHLADRLVVIADHRLHGKFNPNKISSLEIGEIMLGGGSHGKSAEASA